MEGGSPGTRGREGKDESEPKSLQRSWRDNSMAPEAGFVQTQQNELAWGANNKDHNHPTAPPAQISITRSGLQNL